MRPTVGRIVHYYLDPERDRTVIADLAEYGMVGGPLAAIITWVAEDRITLCVLTPLPITSGDRKVSSVWTPVVAEPSETPMPGRWMWPPREGAS